MFLPDVNFWLALMFVTHHLHASAKAWFDGLAAETCYFCRHTQQGFLRLANNPRVMQAEAVAMGEAWRLYDVAMTDVRIDFAEERAGLENAWRKYTGSQSFSPKLWSDAYLAAFAQAAGFQIVTFDKGFSRYSGVQVTILS